MLAAGAPGRGTATSDRGPRDRRVDHATDPDRSGAPLTEESPPAEWVTAAAQSMALEAPLARFAEQGYARLGPVLTASGAEALRGRAAEIMQGKLHDPGMFYQHDAPTGAYDDLAFNKGWVGPSPNYRKIERLERDPLFLRWVENPFFARLTETVLGQGVQLYRMVLWNKAPGGGMAVPWHQDDGRFWGLNQAPMLQVWTALDDAPEASGCLEVVPGSHHPGLATPEGGTVTQACLQEADAEGRAVALPARAGESVLVHNHVWHRTGRNQTPRPRRAISVSFLGPDVRCTRRRRAPRQFLKLFEARSEP